MKNIFKKIITGSLIVFALAGFGHVVLNTNYIPRAFAAVANKIPTTVALYEDSLQSAITASATSFTLVRGTDVVGTSLAASTYGFIIDEGSASQEFILADCTATACTNALRGISPITGLTEVTALKKAHRRGASVKITDAPILLILGRLANGTEAFPNILSYVTHPTFVSDTQIVDKKYVDDASSAGAADASTTVKGISKLSVAPASPTDPIAVGTNDNRVSPVSLATVTTGQVQALAGTSGTPSSSNKYVTDADTTGTGAIIRGSVLSASVKFGGTGADGALNVTSGTTTLDFAGANVLVKNYTSINVSAGATLAFSNPAADGSIIILKSQGAVTFAGTVDIRNLGSTGGAGGVVPANAGVAGTAPYGIVLRNTAAFAGANTPNGNGVEVASTTTVYGITHTQENVYSKMLALSVGGGGGGGYSAAPVGATGGAGGRGAGSMYVESVGVLSITGTIEATGTAGGAGSSGTGNGSGSGGGGGGAGGQFIVLYNSTVTNSGTYNVTGGAGGAGGAATPSSGGSGASGGQGGGNAFAGGAGGRLRSGNGTPGNAGANGDGANGGAGGAGGANDVASGGSGGGGGASGYALVLFNSEFQ